MIYMLVCYVSVLSKLKNYVVRKNINKSCKVAGLDNYNTGGLCYTMRTNIYNSVVYVNISVTSRVGEIN